MSITKLNNLSISAVTALPSGVGGKVLQVITATDSTQRSSSSTSFVTISNTLSVSITPSSASNKIFIICNSTFGNSSQGQAAKATIFRDATNLGDTNGMSIVAPNVYQNTSLSKLDSPNTTSAITYQLYMKSAQATDTTKVNILSSTQSSITAFEIKG